MELSRENLDISHMKQPVMSLEELYLLKSKQSVEVVKEDLQKKQLMEVSKEKTMSLSSSEEKYLTLQKQTIKFGISNLIRVLNNCF